MLYILWDDSHIWGLIAARAARAMAVPHRLVTGEEIARGLLDRRPPSLLLAPGGSARHKAERLGPRGLCAIRSYVAGGGRYLGFCGGAGLALSTPEPGLALCPWRRGRFDERIQHFMSGHLHTRVPGLDGPQSALAPPASSAPPLLPVWWPGRFAPESDSEVTVLAVYAEPSDDFWLADLAIADLPAGTFAAWKDMYGLTMDPSFLEGQPCVIHGRHGKGDYVLSYSHLETPDSPQANAWFAHLLRQLGGLEPALDHVPAWNSPAPDAPPAWEDPVLERIHRDLLHILESGLRHGLLFRRTDWLLGWRAGLPGACLNNLWAALRVILEHPPGNAALAFFAERRDELAKAVTLLRQGSTHYLLAERLAQTTAKFQPDALSSELLRGQREALFGPPLSAGGVYRDIMDPLDRLAFLQLADTMRP